MLLQHRERVVGDAAIDRHLARRPQHRLGQGIELGRTAGAVLGDGADVVVGDAELAAELDVMHILVGAARGVADLEDRHLAQARVELALVADMHGQRGVLRPRRGAVGEGAADVEGVLANVDIGHAGHVLSPRVAHLLR